MRKMMPRQAISAMVALPIVLLANTTEAWANMSGQKIDSIKKVSDLGDRLDLDIPTPTTISIEESEDWDEPEFSATSANLDMQITKFMTEGAIAEIEEPSFTKVMAESAIAEIEEPSFTKFITEGAIAEIEEPPPIIYLSAARGQSTRECRISGICE
jgi:hypothetical protein